MHCIVGKYLVLLCNGSINIIRIISGTDHPVKRFKVLTVGTLRGRFCLSWFREYKICVSSTVFHCYTYDFFHHLVSFCILGFHTVCSLGITSKQNHVCTIRLVNPEVTGLPVTHLPDFICCNFFCFIQRISSRFICVIDLRQQGNNHLHLLFDRIIITLAGRCIHRFQCFVFHIFHVFDGNSTPESHK